METTLPSRPAAPVLRVIDIQVYRIGEDLSEGLIYFMIVFSPWAFGTTQPWSTAVMNICGYAAGALLFVKLGLRGFRHYRPARWDQAGESGRSIHHISARGDEGRSDRKSILPLPFGRGEGWGEGLISDKLTILLVILTSSIVLFCFISAINARATFVPGSAVPIYHQRPAWMTEWLPSSMDSTSTWRAFWNYLALALAFWAIRDWLLGKSETEIRSERESRESAAPAAERGNDSPSMIHHARSTLHAPRSRRHAPLSTLNAQRSTSHLLPARVRRLLWVLSISGGLLALECIIQRAAGSSKLLFMIQPRVNPLGETQFGPFAYRANASQYLNLVWPVTLAFWWTLQRGGAKGVHHTLLVACALTAAGPIVSTSRAGAIISVLLLVLALAVLFGWNFIVPARNGKSGDPGPTLILICGIAAIAIGIGLGWKSLAPRLGQIGGSFVDREGMYEIARPMARDYPVFGTGPGSYATVFQLYRLSADTYWPAQLHNDWLETRITFGWIGAMLIFAAYGTILLRWFLPGGIHGGRRFMILLWLSMGGCLLHARFDFPFQIYSILFLFLVLCALAFDLSRSRA